MTGYWVCAAVTAVSACVSLGYSTAALRSPAGVGRTNPRYAFVRSLALAVAVTVVLGTRSSSWLEAVALAMGLVQAGDAVIGVTIRDRVRTVGPALTAAVNLAALVYFAR